ncbi:MAG: outer membrane beta-barrel family protein, partial [Bacteroidales bacterium]|nr:outer membrane beta-barrel family protein [Bacteroidales bacterium]
KLVLSYPVWKGSLSAGAEYSYTSREDVYNVLSVEQLPVAGSDTEISESSVAAFAEYGRSFGGFYAQIGLRYEHLKNEYSDFGVRQDEVCRSYGDWFPSVTLAYPMSKGPQLSLSYRKDIQRPNYYTLSSSILYINKYSYQSGNPYLTPIYTHNLTFNAAYRWANLTFVYERIIDDIVLQSMPYPGSNDPMVTLISSVNCPDDYNRFTINMSARPVIGVWHPMWNVALFLQNYKTETIDGSTITMNHPYLQIQWINDFLFPHDWRLDSRIVFASKGDYMSYRMTKNIWDTSLGLQKDINTKRVGKFTFDLRCYDPFNLQKSGVLVFGPRNFETINPARRLFSFDVTWRFNEADKKYRGTGAGQSQKSRL